MTGIERTYGALHTLALLALWEATTVAYAIAPHMHYRRRYPLLAGIAATAATLAVPYFYTRIRTKGE